MCQIFAILHASLLSLCSPLSCVFFEKTWELGNFGYKRMKDMKLLGSHPVPIGTQFQEVIHGWIKARRRRANVPEWESNSSPVPLKEYTGNLVGTGEAIEKIDR